LKIGETNMSTPATNVKNATQTIEDMEADFENLANQADAASIAVRYYAADAQLLPPNAPAVTGTAAITKYWQAFLAAGLSDIKMETLEVSISGELAYSIGRYQYTQAGDRHLGKYLAIYRQQPGGGYKATVDTFDADA
jgi:ketosteroid isomerase-like protein